jgi:hypothetical protein
MADEQDESTPTPEPATTPPVEPPPDPGWLVFEHIRGSRPRESRDITPPQDHSGDSRD